MFQLTITAATGLTTVSQHKCSCADGKAFCQHWVAVLYQLSHYQTYNIVCVPETVTSTSVPPRTHDFACRQISDIMILKPTAPDNDSLPQKRKCYGVSCDVYNPINVPLSELRIRDQLMPTLVAHDPESQWLHLWNMEDNPIPVKSQFGTVPRGCVLSYQAPVVIGTSFTSVTDPPDSIFPDFDTTSHLYTSLQVSADESFCRQLKVISSPTKSRSSDN